MLSSSEIMNLIKGMSLPERLLLVEEILKNIREENLGQSDEQSLKKKSQGPAILKLAGIFDNEEAEVFNKAVEESRRLNSLKGTH